MAQASLSFTVFNSSSPLSVLLVHLLGVRLFFVMYSSLYAQSADSLSAATEQMSWLQVIVLSIVQGLTEFLPISSSGHLRIISTMFFGEDAGASFTAVVQLGTEAAVLVFFARDIIKIVVGWFKGLVDKNARGFDYRMGWMVIIGTLPVGIIGFLAKDLIRDSLRNMWITASVLILFSFVFIAAEKWGKKQRGYQELTMKDAIIMGLA